MKNLLNSTSTFASFIASSNPVEAMMAKIAAEAEERKSKHAGARPRNVFSQGEPRRPMNIPHNGPVGYRGPDHVMGKPSTIAHAKSRVKLFRALPRDVAKKMLYNQKRAAAGRWCN